MGINAWWEWAEALNEECHGVNSLQENHYTQWGYLLFQEKCLVETSAVCEYAYPLSDLVIVELSSLSWGRLRHHRFLDRWDRSGNRMRCKRC
jgi:hypothetical protein